MRKADDNHANFLRDEKGHTSSRCSRRGCKYLSAGYDGDATSPSLSVSDHFERAPDATIFDCSGQKLTEGRVSFGTRANFGSFFYNQGRHLRAN